MQAVLCIHLKRFAFDGSGIKLNKPIDFSSILALRPRYLFGQSLSRGKQYRLRSIVVHHGKTMSSGHYTAFVRLDSPDSAGPMADAKGSHSAVQRNGKESWVHCDDTHVAAVAMSDVYNQKAYLLFYDQVEL